MSGYYNSGNCPRGLPKLPPPITPVTTGNSVLLPTLGANKNTGLIPSSKYRRCETTHNRIPQCYNKKKNRTTLCPKKPPTTKCAKLNTKNCSPCVNTKNITACPKNTTQEVQLCNECIPEIYTPEKNPTACEPSISQCAECIKIELTIPRQPKCACPVLPDPQQTSKQDGNVKCHNLRKPLCVEDKKKFTNNPLKSTTLESLCPENKSQRPMKYKPVKCDVQDVNGRSKSPICGKDLIAPSPDCVKIPGSPNNKPQSPPPEKSTITIRTPSPTGKVSPICVSLSDNQQEKLTISINCSMAEKINSVHLQYGGPKPANTEDKIEEAAAADTNVSSVECLEKSECLSWGVEHKLRQESEELINMADEEVSIYKIEK